MRKVVIYMSDKEIEIYNENADEIKIRPYEHHAKYYETDQMGIIHHSNYIKWMEDYQSGALCILRVSQYGTF